jgi:hypothetical protein
MGMKFLFWDDKSVFTLDNDGSCTILWGKEKKQEFVWQNGKFRLSLQLKYKNNNNIY